MASVRHPIVPWLVGLAALLLISTAARAALAYCGDGLPDAGEECDDAGDSYFCDGDCTFTMCGDGYANATAGEECDGMGESRTCDIDCTFAICGDDITNMSADEECDDGGDSHSCDGDCTFTMCGDGYANATAGEECDGMGESAACDADCTRAECGDGTTNMTAGEDCEPSEDNIDTCDPDCTFVACGDGYLNLWAGEECDDGGESSLCDTDCTMAMCGDGFLNVTAGEDCDPGTTPLIDTSVGGNANTLVSGNTLLRSQSFTLAEETYVGAVRLLGDQGPTEGCEGVGVELTDLNAGGGPDRTSVWLSTTVPPGDPVLNDATVPLGITLPAGSYALVLDTRTVVGSCNLTASSDNPYDGGSLWTSLNSAPNEIVDHWNGAYDLHMLILPTITGLVPGGGCGSDCLFDVCADAGTLTCGLGQCEHTIPECIDGEMQTCDPMEGSSYEVCDAVDNDCDGLTDEFLACSIPVTDPNSGSCIPQPVPMEATGSGAPAALLFVPVLFLGALRRRRGPRV